MILASSGDGVGGEGRGGLDHQPVDVEDDVDENARNKR